MPCFSWIAQDTNKPIYRNCSEKRTYYMWDNNGNYWEEPSYEGYGIFGKKDYFILLAEMNKSYSYDVTEEQKRNDGMYIEFTFNQKGIVFPNLTETLIWTWKDERP